MTDTTYHTTIFAQGSFMLLADTRSPIVSPNPRM